MLQFSGIELCLPHFHGGEINSCQVQLSWHPEVIMLIKERIHVLMTGAGAPGAPGIIFCLHQDAAMLLTVADADENATGKYLNEDFLKIPAASDANFTDALLKIAEEKKLDVIVPLVTRELPHFAQHHERFEKIGTKVIVSSEEAIRIANDKSATYRFLQKNNIAVPAFEVVNTVTDFESAVKNLGYPECAVCFKPSISNGSRGFRIISPKIDEHDLLFHQKPNSTYMHFEDAVRVLSSRPFPELLVSEYLPGEEYSVDCLANHGAARLVVPRLRKKMVNGISVEGVFVHDEKIISYCTEIIRALKLHGNIGLQVKRNAGGEALLLEINPRVQGTIVAAMGAGVNLPLLAVKQELHMPITEDELQVSWNTRFSRYWTEVFY